MLRFAQHDNFDFFIDLLEAGGEQPSPRFNAAQRAATKWFFAVARSPRLVQPSSPLAERRDSQSGASGFYRGPTTGLVSVPIPSTVMLTESPGLRKTGGLRKTPTPGGVPVEIRSPGSQVRD